LVVLRYQNKDWSFDGDASELCVTRTGERIPLCSERKPRAGAYPIIRIGEHEWQVAPARYDSGYFLRARPDFIVLIGSPDHVDAQLFDLLFLA